MSSYIFSSYFVNDYIFFLLDNVKQLVKIARSSKKRTFRSPTQEITLFDLTEFC